MYLSHTFVSFILKHNTTYANTSQYQPMRFKVKLRIFICKYFISLFSSNNDLQTPQPPPPLHTPMLQGSKRTQWPEDLAGGAATESRSLPRTGASKQGASQQPGHSLDTPSPTLASDARLPGSPVCFRRDGGHEWGNGYRAHETPREKADKLSKHHSRGRCQRRLTSSKCPGPQRKVSSHCSEAAGDGPV